MANQTELTQINEANEALIFLTLRKMKSLRALQLKHFKLRDKNQKFFDSIDADYEAAKELIRNVILRDAGWMIEGINRITTKLFTLVVEFDIAAYKVKQLYPQRISSELGNVCTAVQILTDAKAYYQELKELEKKDQLLKIEELKVQGILVA